MTSNVLPIYSAIDEIVRAVETYRKVVIHAPPGTGKSTCVPLELHRRLDLAGDIRVAQPRRLAARSLATYVASLTGTKVGETIGYEVRFDRKISDRTAIRFATDGLLLRQVLSDPLMEKTSGIVIDEFHERSVRNDLLAACVREIGETRDDFFTVIMSATLAADDVAKFFDAPIVSVKAPVFPLEISHLDRGSSRDSLQDDLAEVLTRALSETDGDVLVFLPGLRDIEVASSRCESRGDIDVRRLYGALSPRDQTRALSKSDRRRVIFSTNIAETSLTVPGVRVVIDSGWEKVNLFDPSTGFDKLNTQRISEASATQRAGRAAREAAGSAYRLWSSAESFRFQPFRAAEIQRIDPIRALLEAAEWAGSVDAMQWYEAPPEGARDRAVSELRSIGALDGDRITRFGKRLLSYPLSPRLAALIEHGIEHDAKAEAALLAAVLSEPDTFDAPKSAVECDVCFRAKRLASQRNHPGYKIAKQVAGTEPKFSVPNSSLRELLFETYPDRVAIKRGENRYALASGGSVTLVGSRVRTDLILALRIHGTKKVDGVSCGKVFLATAIEPEWLEDKTETTREVIFDAQTETVSVFQLERFGELILKRTRGARSDASNEEISAALLPAVQKNPEKAFKIDKKVAQFLTRYEYGFYIESIFDDDDIVRSLIGSATSFKETRAKSLMHELKRAIPYDKIAKLDREFPASIVVPSGKRHTIDYSVDPPVLAVRIQELFGWDAVPDIGFVIRLHLLAPNYRPAQITDDLMSFWDNTYPEVRKELRARYPKHAWPEDPRSIKAKAK